MKDLNLPPYSGYFLKDPLYEKSDSQVNPLKSPYRTIFLSLEIQGKEAKYPPEDLERRFQKVEKFRGQGKNLERSSQNKKLCVDGEKLFENQLVSYKEAARYLRLSETHLRRLKSEGKIPFVSVGSRGVRFRVSSLNAWIAEREIK